MIPVPPVLWQNILKVSAWKMKSELRFMSEEHHRVRNFLVQELANVGSPLTPAHISTSLNLSVDQVATILDELEQKMMFLVRNEQGAVTWAYPVTVEQTAHQVRLSPDEIFYSP